MPKKDTHPQYNKEVVVNCICGSSFTVASTLKWPIKIETCPACHPAYNKGLVVKQVSKGRMEKYAEKMKKIDAVKETKTAKSPKAKKAA